jgi:rare lipoprotein A
MKKIWFYLALMIVLSGCSAANRTISGNEILGEGVASWYGPGFHGNTTANGERYDQNALTAAHRTLPFNTIVRVVNLENGRTVDVRINDRGPFVDNRIIDLSREAASRIDMIQSGLAPVRIILLSSSAPIDPALQRGEKFTVQIASLTSERDAREMASKFEHGWVKPAVVNNRQFFRVFVGTFMSHSDADRQRRKLRRQGVNGFVKQVQN